MSDKKTYPLQVEECNRLLNHCWPWLPGLSTSGHIAKRTCQHCGYTQRLVQPESHWEPLDDPA